MRIESISSDAFTISDAPALDPITVIFIDIGPERGRMIVTCFDKAWAAYWGATGEPKVRDFVIRSSTDYLVNKLSHEDTKKHEERYLKRIVEAIKQSIGMMQ